jgi:predicted HAD superfamily hydrolase
MYKLRTVDVWDTLLRRDCHPECIKLATALHLFLGWSDQLKLEFRDYWSLYRARIDAERCVAEESRSKGKDDEYEITQVVSYWVDLVFPCPVAAHLLSELAEFELNTEIARSFADPEIAEFLSLYQAEKTLFLSDFYMNATTLRHLLSAKGLSALVPDGISSCDAGFNKRSGQLFRHVHALQGVSPEEHVHVGDNLWSDVESPRKVGATSLHFLPEAAHAERLERERLFSSRDALFEHVRRECFTLAARTADIMPDRQSAAFRFGAEAAPLFIGFLLWVAEQAVVEKLDRIYFLTREGEFFHRIYSALLPHDMFFGYNLPPCHVLAVSRLATFAASMQNVSIEEMSRIWTLFKSQSVSGLFATLRLDVRDFSAELEEVGLKVGDVADDPMNHSALEQLFRIDTFVNAVKHSIRSQKDMVYDYLEQNDLPPSKRVGVVDVGWRGTIQDNLAILVPHTQFHGMYLGLRRLINPQPTNVSKSAYGPDENHNPEFCNLFENFAALELLCTSPKGSVICYRRIDGKAIPQRQIVDSENAGFEDFTKHFQKGVLLAARHWQPYLERYVVTGAELRYTALHIWETLRRAPGRDLAELFMRTPQYDVFGFGDIFQRNQLPSVSTILLAPIFKRKRRWLIEFIRRVQWSAAIDHVQGVGRFHRGILVLTFRLANLVKRRRIKVQMGRTNANR